jgi:hypothetical protein
VAWRVIPQQHLYRLGHHGGRLLQIGRADPRTVGPRLDLHEHEGGRLQQWHGHHNVECHLHLLLGVSGCSPSSSTRPPPPAPRPPSLAPKQPAVEAEGLTHACSSLARRASWESKRALMVASCARMRSILAE